MFVRSLCVWHPSWVLANTVMGTFPISDNKRDQHQFSRNNIRRSSRVKVMRITQLITKERML